MWLLSPLAAAQGDAATEGKRAFALAHEGNAAEGKRVFEKLACAQCHSTDGSGMKAGPDLAATGDKFPKAELIRAILEPSAAIAVGYDSTLLTRQDGSLVSGVIKQATADWVELMGADGRAIRVPATDIAKRETLPVSLMPEGLALAGSDEDFANLIAYVGSLHQALAGNAVEDVPKASSPVGFESFFDDSIQFREPLWFGAIPGRENAYVVLEHYGQAWIVEKKPAGDVRTSLIDLRNVVREGGATGLLGMAFHPKFPKDPRYFLKYQIVEDGKISTLIVERRFTKDLQGDSGEPPRQLLKIPSTTQDHNGGCLAFGPDGFLYFGMGDTGPQRDPQGHAQDMGLLLGKLLRIDIDHREGGLPYAIPADNPFLNRAGVRPEIWAVGFREPWRFSWDSATGDLWLGDVGQDQYEEVGIVRAGENHGWNVIEGFNPYSEKFRQTGVALVAPVWSYSHRLGDSVTGGYVYRGSRAPAMNGWYIFGDHDSRRIWALTQKDRRLGKVIEIGLAPSRAVSFSQTADGEIYLAGFNSGKIYHLDLAAVDLRPQEVRVRAATSEKAPAIARITTRQPAATWTAEDFNDSDWTEAAGGYGTVGTPGAVVRTDWQSSDIWVRREFNLETAPDPKSRWSLRVHHDEDAEIYINGVLAANLPKWTQGYSDFELTAEAVGAMHAGRNVMAIHCHQNGGGQYIDAGLMELSKP